MANDSVYWIYTNGTITIGADEGATNTIVMQDATNLPWLSVIRKEQVNSVVFRATGDASNPTRVKPVNFGGNGHRHRRMVCRLHQSRELQWYGRRPHADLALANLFRECNSLNSLNGIANWNTSKITTLQGMFDGCNLMTVQPIIGAWDTSKVENFSYMFRNTKDLVTVDSIANWDVTAAKTFEGMFEGANFIVTLDISGWNMPASANRTNMFSYLEALTIFKICQTVILAGTALDDAELVKTRIDSTGSWDCSDGIWFGTTRNLASRYDGNCIVPGKMTYTWSSNNLRGRFDSNDNAWWKFDRTAGGLTLGTDEYKGTGPNPDPAIVNRVVTEDATRVPWLRALGENYSVLIRMISVDAGEDLNPTSFAGWFKNYHQLASFNGAGLVLDGNTSLEQLFYGDERLSSVTGLNTWDVSRITSFAGMVRGGGEPHAALRRLELEDHLAYQPQRHVPGNAASLLVFAEAAGWDVSHVTDFAGIFDGAVNLAILDISGWNMTASANVDRMFADCGKLGTACGVWSGYLHGWTGRYP